MASETPLVAGMAGRYATALFDLAKEQGQLEAVEASLSRLAAALKESADLTRLTKSPAFSAETQSKALSALFKVLDLDRLTGNFLLLLVKNRRLFAVEDIIKAFQHLAAASRGEVAADVISAVPLADEQIQALADTLREKLGKTAKIHAKVDPSLLGGLIVRIGSRMVDTSIRTKLNSLKLAMKEVG